jgi:PEP-CTERM motif
LRKNFLGRFRASQTKGFYMRISLLLGTVAMSALAKPAQAITLYSNDFDGNLVIDSGVTAVALNSGGLETASAGAWNAAGWVGNYFVNRSGGNPASLSQLTLTGLKSHTNVSLGGVLGFLESWDGFDGGCCSPDNLEFYIDGNLVATMTANNALGSSFNFAGGNVIALYQEVNGVAFFSDSLADIGTMSFANFAHTGSSLTLAIRASGNGWQGGTDEAWGIDALNVTYNGVAGVPEPANWALMIAGFGLVGAATRRRTKVRINYA